MPLSVGQRQARWRARHLQAGTVARASFYLSPEARARLDRLTRYLGKSQRATIEELLQAGESTVMAAMTPAARRDYLGQKADKEERVTAQGT